MNKIVATIVLILVLALGLLVWFSRLSESNTVSSASVSHAGGSLPDLGGERLSAKETIFDFGVISMANGKVGHVFEVSNLTDDDTVLSVVETSCMCTIAFIETASGKSGPFGMPGHGGSFARANQTIGAGQFVNIRVVYDPNAHGPAGIGQIERFIDLTEANGITLRLAIRAMVTP